MFYENYLKLCNSVGQSPTAVAKAVGLSGAHVTKWKKGSTPTDATIHKICDQFDLPYDFFESDHSHDYLGIGNRIKYWCQQKDYSLRKLADELGMPYRAVLSFTSTGNGVVLPSVIQKISTLLDVPAFLLDCSVPNTIEEAQLFFKIVAQNMKQFRIEKGLSEKQVDLIFSWPYGQTQQLEEGKYILSENDFQYYCRSLETMPFLLVDGEAGGKIDWGGPYTLDEMRARDSVALRNYSIAYHLLKNSSLITSDENVSTARDQDTSGIPENPGLTETPEYIEIDNPDILLIVQASSKMTQQQARHIRKYAQFFCPEAFDGIDV